MGVDFDKLREKVLEQMNKGKSGDVGNELRKAFEKMDTSDFQIFGEIMKEAIKKMSGGDEELEKKVKFYYDQFATPDEDTDEKREERVKNALTLATGAKPVNPLGGSAISSAGGATPGIPAGGQDKISEGAKDVAGKLGISEKTLKKHKVI